MTVRSLPSNYRPPSHPLILLSSEHGFNFKMILLSYVMSSPNCLPELLAMKSLRNYLAHYHYDIYKKRTFIITFCKIYILLQNKIFKSLKNKIMDLSWYTNTTIELLLNCYLKRWYSMYAITVLCNILYNQIAYI